MTDHEGHEVVDEGRRIPPILIVTGIILVAIAIFVLQNTEEIRFDFLVFSFDAPLWLVLAIVFVLGALAGQGALWYRRRRKRRAEATD